MNPEFQAPRINPEQRPITPDNSEHLPVPERSGEQSREHEQQVSPGERQSSPPVQMPVIPLPPTAPVLPTVTPVSTDDAAGPALANDDDLIEKEWVDKAKKIIAETQNDPYRREKEVNKLQIDYLRKRYGKELGTSN